MGNQRGASTIAILFYLALFVGAIYLIVIFASPNISHYQIEKVVDQAALNLRDPDKNLVIYLARKVHELNLPVKEEDFKVERDDYTVKVSIEWQHEVVVIPENRFVPRYSRILHFYHEATEEVNQR